MEILEKKCQDWRAQTRHSTAKPFNLILLMLLLCCDSKIQQLRGSIRNLYFCLTLLDSLGCYTRLYLTWWCRYLIQFLLTSLLCQRCQTQRPTCLFFSTMISALHGILMHGKLFQLSSDKPVCVFWFFFFPWIFFFRLLTVIISQKQ